MSPLEKLSLPPSSDSVDATEFNPEPLSVVTSQDWAKLFNFRRLDNGFFASGADHKGVFGSREVTIPTEVPIIIDSAKESDQPIGELRNFYTADKVCYTSSSCTKEMVEEVYGRYLIDPSRYRPFLPENRSAMQCCPPFMVVYADHLDSGLRFPIHPFIMEVCDKYCIGLPQLVPTAVRCLVAFITKCLELGIEPSIKVFSFLFTLKKTYSWYYICKRVFEKVPNNIFSDSLGSNKSGWSSRFFFIKSSEALPSIWRAPFTGYPDVEFDEISYSLLSRLLDEGPKSVGNLVDEKMLISTGYWHKNTRVPLVTILPMPAGYEITNPPLDVEVKATKRTNPPLDVEVKATKRKPSGSFCKIAAMEAATKKKPKQAKISEGSMATHQVKGAASFKVLATGNGSPSNSGVFEPSHSQSQRDAALKWLPSHCREKLATSIEFVDKVRNSGMLTSPTLDGVDIYPGYDSHSEGNSVLDNSEKARHFSAKLLTPTDKAFLSDYTLESRLDVLSRYQLHAALLTQSVKEEVIQLQHENFTFRDTAVNLAEFVAGGAQVCLEAAEKFAGMEDSLTELQDLRRKSMEVEALRSEIKDVRAREKKFSDQVKDLETREASMVQELASLKSSQVHAVEVFKSSSEGQKWRERKGLGYFLMASNFFKKVISDHGIVGEDKFQDLEELNLLDEVKLNNELSEVLDDGPASVSIPDSEDDENGASEQSDASS